MPALTPVTIPVEPTVAMNMSLQLHTPPVGAEANDVNNPIHTFLIPVILDGTGLTVTITVVKQPVANV